EDLTAARGVTRRQLLEELVVMVGEWLEHVRASLGLALVKLGGNVDALRFLPGPVFERIFERQVDEPADLLAVPDRNLPGDQWRDADRLKRREEIAHAAVRLIDSVDEDDVRDAMLV